MDDDADDDEEDVVVMMDFFWPRPGRQFRPVEIGYGTFHHQTIQEDDVSVCMSYVATKYVIVAASAPLFCVGGLGLTYLSCSTSHSPRHHDGQAESPFVW